MDNNNKSSKTVKAILSDGDFLALINLAGVNLEKRSPLGQIGPKPSTEAAGKLQQTGLLDSGKRPTADCVEALAILANPGLEFDLIWGTPEGMSLSKAYARAGQDKLASYTRVTGSNHLSFFLSSQDLTDLVADKLARPAINQPSELSLEVSSAASPVMFAILDLYREAQLTAALERRQEFEVKVTPEEVNRILQEAKLESNLTWYAPVGNIIFPNKTAINEAEVSEGINILKKGGLIGSDGGLQSGMMNFAYLAFPLLSYVGIKVYTGLNGPIEKAQIALFRGINSLLVIQRTSDEGGTSRDILSSISTSQLPEILFSLATRFFEVAAPQVKQPTGSPVNNLACGKCGAPNPPAAKFCTKCGAALSAAAAIKFCPKCGDPVTGGEKFCDKCGTKLV